MASSAANRVPPSLPAGRPASDWTSQVGRVFRRVAFFEVTGTTARVRAVQGVGQPPLGSEISLLEQTPLRWAVAAASPIVGAGTSPGGGAIAAAMGLSAPRAFVVIPLVAEGRLQALIYADQASEPLPLSGAAEVFAFCHRVLSPHAAPTRLQPARISSTSSRPGGRAYRVLGLTYREGSGTPSPAVVSEPPGSPRASEQPASPEASPVLVDLPLPEHRVTEAKGPTRLEPVSSETLADSRGAAEASVLAPDGLAAPMPGPPESGGPAGCSAGQTGSVLPSEDPAPNTARPAPAAPLATVQEEAPADFEIDAALFEPSAWRWPGGFLRLRALLHHNWIVSCASVGLVLGLLTGLLWVSLAPPAGTGSGSSLVQIPRNATVGEIATILANRRLVRSARAFTLLARIEGVDRTLKAGAYLLPQGRWAWSVVAELHRGQVHTRTVTIPEGLTLREVAALLEQEGLAKVDAVLAAGQSPELLRRYQIPASSVEGYLFPETYTLAEGLSATATLEVMLDEFRDQLTELGATALSPETLLTKVTLASIVQREARDESELPRVAGVFLNRLDRHMRLESCATVQYVLGRPQARLTLEDVRTPSPYNTYLQAGLPPGPISNPGRAALEAVLSAEKHDFFFFFARQDGSHTHEFSRTFAEHQAKQRELSQQHKHM